ncbi:MAG: FAD-binding oxidoreductase, partial [Pseudomonas sp.]
MKVASLPGDDQTCGWYHLSKGRTVRPAHTGHSRARWVIVGAGFTGLATARQLATHFPDEHIVLVDAQEVGYGTSGRNAGFVIDLPHDIGAPDYIGDIATAKTTMQLNLSGKNYLTELVERF